MLSHPLSSSPLPALTKVSLRSITILMTKPPWTNATSILMNMITVIICLVVFLKEIIMPKEIPASIMIRIIMYIMVATMLSIECSGGNYHSWGTVVEIGPCRKTTHNLSNPRPKTLSSPSYHHHHHHRHHHYHHHRHHKIIIS